MNVIASVRKGDDDWEERIVELDITNDKNGRLYVKTDEIEIGMDLPDVMKAIQDKIVSG